MKLPRSDGALNFGTVTFPTAVGGSADVSEYRCSAQTRQYTVHSGRAVAICEYRHACQLLSEAECERGVRRGL